MPVPNLPHEPFSDTTKSDGRSPLALGYMWATVIMSTALEMTLPVLLGIYVDYKLGTKCVFLLLGIFFGFCALIVNFIKLLHSKDFLFSAKKKK